MSVINTKEQKKNIISVIVPDICDYFYSGVIACLSDLAEKKGFTILTFPSNDSFKQENEIINTVVRNNTAGVIASVTSETTSSDHFKKLEKYKIPLVMFDRIIDNYLVPNVISNNIEISGWIVSELLRKGNKKIAYICGPESVQVFLERRNGYQKTINDNNLNYMKCIEIKNKYTSKDVRKTLQDLYQTDMKPDGIICETDGLLKDVLLELREMQTILPGNIKVAGFSENTNLKVCFPELIIASRPIDLISYKLFDLLMNYQNNNYFESITIASSIL